MRVEFPKLRACLLLLLLGLPAILQGQTTHTIALGADLSFVPSLEDDGGKWYDNGVEGDPLDQFHDNGWSIIRLRLWHTPDPNGWERYHSLDSTIVYAKRAVAAGHQWMLDFHYSDYWADPGQQWPPAAWQGLSINFLEDSLYFYTRAVLERCRAEGVMPDYIQLGNEIDPGMCWPVGSVQDRFSSGGWDNLATLLKAGELAVRHAARDTTLPMVIYHLANGSDYKGVRMWVDSLQARNVPFHMLGFSYYPWWQGPMEDLAYTMHMMANGYGLPMMVVETSYPSTLGWYPDNGTNTVGDTSQTLPEYPPTPEGQLAYHEALEALVANVHGRLGKGLLWWEPGWVPVEGRRCGFENLTAYDFEGNALPLLHQKSVSDVGAVGVALPRSFELNAWPNPFNDAVTVWLEGGPGGTVRLELYDLLGRRLGEWTLPGSSARTTLDLGAHSSGVYLLRASTGSQSQTRRITLLR